MSSPQKSRKSETTCLRDLASATISFVIPVSPVIIGEMCEMGWMNSINRSATLPSRTFSSPISMISFSMGFSPVVSMSNAMYDLSITYAPLLPAIIKENREKIQHYLTRTVFPDGLIFRLSCHIIKRNRSNPDAGAGCSHQIGRQRPHGGAYGSVKIGRAHV